MSRCLCNATLLYKGFSSTAELLNREWLHPVCLSLHSMCVSHTPEGSVHPQCSHVNHDQLWGAVQQVCSLCAQVHVMLQAEGDSTQGLALAANHRHCCETFAAVPSECLLHIIVA